MNKKTKELNKNRLLFLYSCIIAAFILLATRLIFVVLSGDQVKINNIYKPKELIRRADIVDRNNVIVATDLNTKSLYAHNTLIRNPKLVAKKLSEKFPELGYSYVLKKVSKERSRKWTLIKRNVTPKQQQIIKNLGIAALTFEDNKTRIYPQRSILSHLIGYVDLDRNGLSGIEKSYDGALKAGQNKMRLSIDIRVQDVLNNELLEGIKKYKALSASGVIMDVTNGEVIAIASLPNFDPNNQAEATSNQRFNRATYGVYEFGSIFKIFTNAIAFDKKLINIDDVYNVKEPIKYGRFIITDDHPEKDNMSVEEIFSYSSNIGTVQIAEKIGEKVQKEYFKKLGLLDRIESNYPALGKPIYPKRWKQVSTATISYGHGIAITPLHIASAVSAVVNGGILYKPSFTKLEAPEKGTKVLNESTSDIMNVMLRKVVTQGTGKNANVKGYKVGGKTGTAERAEYGGYNKNKTMASFVAVFPTTKPKYLVFVSFDRPNYSFNTGGMVAAPVVGKIIKNITPIIGIEPIS